MTAILALVIASLAAWFGYSRTRDWSSHRLRYTRVAERPVAAGFVVGVGTSLLAAPVVALAPIVGAGTALALGVGVGTGLVRGVGGSRV